MAAKVDKATLGLVCVFTDFSLLGDVFARPLDQWAGFLRDRCANLDHVKDSDLPPGNVYAHMAYDIYQLGQRLGLITDKVKVTEVGRVIRAIGAKPEEARGPDDGRVISETLSAQIVKDYRGHDGLSLTDLLQDAARRVARVPGNWAGYCPGLLLGEVRRLIPLAHEAPAAKTDKDATDDEEGEDGTKADTAKRFVAELVRIRIGALEAAGMRAPDPGLTWIQNVVAYAAAVNAHHLSAIAEKEKAGRPSITLTEARATAILLTYAGLLVQLQTLGPVQCLGAPTPPDVRPPRSPLDPVPVTLSDGSVWDMGGLDARLVATLMRYLMNDEDGLDREVIFPNLGIDRESRKAADNALILNPREIARHNWINRGTAMEMLSGLLLARLDSAREVLCNIETRHGLPHQYAGGGLTDIEVAYEMPGTAPGFQAIGAVSAKSDVNEDFLRDQLDQAHKHAKAIAKRTGLRVYALVLNCGKIGSDDKLLATYRQFVKDKKLREDETVRLLPMYASDLASAVLELEATLPPGGLRCGADVLAEMFDRLIDGLLDPEPKGDDWMRTISTRVVRAGTPLAPNRPSGGGGQRLRGLR